MRKICLLLLLGVFGGTLLRAQNPIVTTSEITSVTVYLSGAQITRIATVPLPAGESEVLFQDLAADIYANSIQAGASDDIIIESVSQERNYLRPAKTTPEMQVLQDSTDQVNSELEIIRTELQTIGVVRDMINENRQVKGTEAGVSLEELAAVADYYRDRLSELKQKQNRLEERQKTLNEKKRVWAAELQLKRGQLAKPSHDVLLKVRCDRPVSTQIQIKYFISQASWTPRYDLRAVNSDGPVDLTYHANVRQNTGKNWDNVRLTLSSSDPNLNGNPPELAIQKLYLAEKLQIRGGRGKGYNLAEADLAYGGTYRENDLYVDGVYTGSTQRAGATAANFELDARQDVPGDNQPQQVTISRTELPAEYRHATIPKLDLTTYLMARITDFDRLSLLPGAVSVYFDGTYIAETFMNPQVALDTLNFSFGQDPKIVVEREQLADYREDRILGSKVEKTFAWEVRLRNTKNKPVTVRVVEQVPQSRDEDIKVEVVEMSNGKYDEETGRVEWLLEIPPGETRKLTFSYSIRSPKNRPITIN